MTVAAFKKCTKVPDGGESQSATSSDRPIRIVLAQSTTLSLLCETGGLRLAEFPDHMCSLLFTLPTKNFSLNKVADSLGKLPRQLANVTSPLAAKLICELSRRLL
eukprot:gnl/TRDRNA2_/TRDRNA2_117886_c0_seq1.p2 gnl/TRDRNA2_/TRDRNA2_117886_c0~~gnl/TRDRNA2_/TRDRNA2_117886_c0_seq1.p2  ORF type:complete len:105 (-),score=9.88 gnl/TRDRNA2_/TRDRNA2_117886_c0_seq1:198-512(-)